jgi:hypothetical protein
MVDAVQVSKNLFPKGGRNEQTKNTGGNVPEKVHSLNHA